MAGPSVGWRGRPLKRGRGPSEGGWAGEFQEFRDAARAPPPTRAEALRGTASLTPQAGGRRQKLCAKRRPRARPFWRAGAANGWRRRQHGARGTRLHLPPSPAAARRSGAKTKKEGHATMLSVPWTPIRPQCGRWPRLAVAHGRPAAQPAQTVVNASSHRRQAPRRASAPRAAHCPRRRGACPSRAPVAAVEALGARPYDLRGRSARSGRRSQRAEPPALTTGARRGPERPARHRPGRSEVRLRGPRTGHAPRRAAPLRPRPPAVSGHRS